MNNRKTPIIRFKGFTDDWEQRKLSDLVDVCSGRDYKHLYEGMIPVYGTGGYMLSVSEALSYDRDAIGIGRKGTIDKPYVLKAPFWTVDTLFYAVPEHPECLDFIHDVFQIIDWKKKDESTGVPSLSKEAINDTNVMVPKIDEQIIIGGFSARIDHLITLHQRKLEKLKIVKKAMLENCFPKNGEKVPKFRFSGFTDDWEQRKLGELCSEFKSGDFIRADEIAETGSYPVFGGNGLRGYTDRYNHDGDFALIGRQGALCGNMNFSSGKAYFTEHAVAVKADKSNDTRFLFYCFGTMNLGQYSGQSAQPGLAVGNLVELETMVPTKTEQECISASLTALDHLITLHQRKLEKLKIIKKSFLEKMFV